MRKIWSYVIELAECDLNYDIRDRSRFLKKVLSSNLECHHGEEANSESEKNKQSSCMLVECILGGETKALRVPSEPIDYRFYLPGSLSQLVFHAAPGYEPLPKPCSLPYTDLDRYDGAAKSDSDEEDTDTSGPLDEESASDYSSEQSITASGNISGSDESVSGNEAEDNADPLIQISDTGDVCENQNVGATSGTEAFQDLMSTKSLESWLDEPTKSSKQSEIEQSRVRRSSARITIGNIGSRVKPKCYTLLDPANGNGLKVNYSFSSDTSTISSHLVCLEVLFENCSLEPMVDIVLIDEDYSKSSDSTDQISSPTEK